MSFEIMTLCSHESDPAKILQFYGKKHQYIEQYFVTNLENIIEILKKHHLERFWTCCLNEQIPYT